jgi:hypothetical protein
MVVDQIVTAKARWRASTNIVMINASVEGISDAPATPSSRRATISISGLVE